MKVSISPSLEFDIALSPDEISMLERETVKGSGIIRELPRDNTRRIELSRGVVLGGQNNLFIELISLPRGASYETITDYIVVITDAGYGLLKEMGAICDRTGGPSRINIHSTEYRR